MFLYTKNEVDVMAKKRGKRRVAKKKRVSNLLRKASPKSRVEVIYKKKSFGKAPVEKHFILQDGRKLDSLFQLVDELETMSEDAFGHYVSEFRNDFATWVRDVFESRPLADELEHVRDRITAQRAIMKHLLRDVSALARKHGHEHNKKEEHKHPRKAVKLVIEEP